ncbi:YdcF family protein [Echinicola jeungdonensis]|uniref:YdcF family protein n=1 Tax=Echinicola jeungdonensis TaxID=709343 RepID=A0ABV5J806_9BACT|nr:YdcF family protein [Echinicola jeungdonensis]MDN3668045.1 YdcF family protein [Echinicola jeungdonensis]
MFFILSQLLSFLVMPLTLVIICFLAGMLYLKKKWGKKLLMLGIILLLLFTNKWLSNTVMNAWEPPYKSFETLPDFEMGIVLTGVTNLDKTAYDRTFFNKGADRATHAVQLYKMGKINKILITGGQGFDPVNSNTEAELLADFMEMAGVPARDILIENKAKNTYQNAIFSKEKLLESGFDLNSTYLLITSAFHIKRAKGCFDKAGLATETFPVDYYSSDSKVNFQSLLQPTPEGLLLWHKLFKEWIGIIAYKMMGYL